MMLNGEIRQLAKRVDGKKTARHIFSDAQICDKKTAGSCYHQQGTSH